MYEISKKNCKLEETITKMKYEISDLKNVTAQLENKVKKLQKKQSQKESKPVPIQTEPGNSPPRESFCQATTSSMAASSPYSASSINMSSMIAHVIPLTTLPYPTTLSANTSNKPSEAEKTKWMQEIMDIIDKSKIMK